MQPSVSAGHGPALSHRGRRSPWLRRAIVFVTCAVLADALFGDRGLAERMKLLQDYERARAALSRLKEENAGLREQARRLREDPATIEGVAREDLGLIRPGEILVVVKDVK